jgi:hypothetical protein
MYKSYHDDFNNVEKFYVHIKSNAHWWMFCEYCEVEMCAVIKMKFQLQKFKLKSSTFFAIFSQPKWIKYLSMKMFSTPAMNDRTCTKMHTDVIKSKVKVQLHSYSLPQFRPYAAATFLLSTKFSRHTHVYRIHKTSSLLLLWHRSSISTCTCIINCK